MRYAQKNVSFGIRQQRAADGGTLPASQRKQVLSIACSKLPTRVLHALAMQCWIQLERGQAADQVGRWKQAMVLKMTTL